MGARVEPAPVGLVVVLSLTGRAVECEAVETGRTWLLEGGAVVGALEVRVSVEALADAIVTTPEKVRAAGLAKSARLLSPKDLGRRPLRRWKLACVLGEKLEAAAWSLARLPGLVEILARAKRGERPTVDLRPRWEAEPRSFMFPRNDTAGAFAVLGLSPGASSEAVKRAYRDLARKHHPDAGGDVTVMKKINAAVAAIEAAARHVVNGA